MSGPGPLRRRASRAVRVLLENFPALQVRFYLWRARHHGEQVSELTSSSRLAVVGFEGSGNSYFRVAFNRVNPDAGLASHIHVAGLAAVATRLGVPLLILVRDPADAVASKLTRFPGSSAVGWALADYARFYERCRRHIGSSVVATFAAATGRPGAVTAAVNDRFGVAFQIFPDSDEEEVAEALRFMQRQSVVTFGAQAAMRGSAPSPERATAKEDLLAQIFSTEQAAILERCRKAAQPFFEAAAASGL